MWIFFTNCLTKWIGSDYPIFHRNQGKWNKQDLPTVSRNWMKIKCNRNPYYFRKESETIRQRRFWRNSIRTVVKIRRTVLLKMIHGGQTFPIRRNAQEVSPEDFILVKFSIAGSIHRLFYGTKVLQCYEEEVKFDCFLNGVQNE